MIITQGFGTASGGAATYSTIDVSVSQVDESVLIQSEDVSVSVSDDTDGINVAILENEVSITEEDENVEVSQ